MDPSDHVRTNLVAGALTSTHLSIRTLMPLLLAALGSAYAFGEGQLGDLGAAYSAGATLAAMTSPLWMKGRRMRGPTITLLLVGIAAVATMLFVRKFMPLMALFAVAGAGLGGVFALMISLLSRTDDPNRSYGWQWALGSVPGILLVYLAPAVSTPTNALVVTLGLVLATNMVAGLPAILLPSRLGAAQHRPSIAAAPRRRSWPVGVGLIAILATYSGITGAWAFFGRIAVANGLGAVIPGVVLAIATAASSAVSLLAGEAGHRGSRPLPMVMIGLAILMMLVLVGQRTDAAAYGIGVVTSIALAGWLLPLVVGIVPKLDPTGRSSGLPAAALGVGAVTGPAVAGHVYQAAGAPTMLLVAGLTTLAGTAAYVAVHGIAAAMRHGA